MEVMKILCGEIPQVSIIIPHLPERDIDTTLRSIGEQREIDYEIIVVTDKEREGISKAYNVGIENVNDKAGFVMFFADDTVFITPDAFKKIYDTAKSHAGKFVYCNGKWHGIDHNPGEYNIEKLKGANYINGIIICPVKGLPKFDEELKRLVDWDYLLALNEVGITGQYLPEMLWNSKAMVGGISSNNNDLLMWRNKVREKWKI